MTTDDDFNAKVVIKTFQFPYTYVTVQLGDNLNLEHVYPYPLNTKIMNSCQHQKKKLKYKYDRQLIVQTGKKYRIIEYVFIICLCACT